MAHPRETFILISQSSSSPDTRLSPLNEVFSLTLKTLSGETITNSHFIRNQLVSMHACMLSHFSHVHGIFQARLLGWVAISSSRDLPDPGIEPASPASVEGFFNTEPLGKSSILVVDPKLKHITILSYF